MGFYINPTNMEKEDWLNNHGLPLLASPLLFRRDGSVAICLVNNGGFTAAAVCYSQRELNRFNQPHDYRPKDWYMVPINDLIAVGAIKSSDQIEGEDV